VTTDPQVTNKLTTSRLVIYKKSITAVQNRNV